jgi:hypothetical protein
MMLFLLEALVMQLTTLSCTDKQYAPSTLAAVSFWEYLPP